MLYEVWDMNGSVGILSSLFGLAALLSRWASDGGGHAQSVRVQRSVGERSLDSILVGLDDCIAVGSFKHGR